MKTRINPPNFTKTVGAYSQAMKVDLGNKSLILVSGQLAMDAEGNAVAPGDIGAQARYIFENIKTILREAGATLEDVVKTQFFLTDINQFAEVSAVRNEYLAEVKPASVLIEISRTIKDGCDVELEVMAIVDNHQAEE